MFHIQMDTLHLPDESAAREVNRHKQSLAHSSSPDLRSQSPRLELQKKHPLRHPSDCCIGAVRCAVDAACIFERNALLVFRLPRSLQARSTVYAMSGIRRRPGWLGTCKERGSAQFSRSAA